MITNFKKFNLIKENPDTIHLYDDNDNYLGNYYCQDDEARPFFIVPNSNHTKVEKILIGDFGCFHGIKLNYLKI